MSTASGVPSLVQDYVAGLPAGLDSYPHCQCKGSAWRSTLQGVDDLPGLAKCLPPPVAALVVTPPAENVWVPETYLGALLLGMRATCFDTDEEMFQLTLRQNLTLLEGPVYRILFKVAAPSWVLSGAEGRWGAFHRGTAISVLSKDSKGGTSALEYPRRLVTRVAAGVFLSAFKAALEVAGAKQPSVEITSHTEERTEFRASWG